MRKKQVGNGNGMPKFTADKSQKQNPSFSFQPGPSFTSSYCFTAANTRSHNCFYQAKFGCPSVKACCQNKTGGKKGKIQKKEGKKLLLFSHEPVKAKLTADAILMHTSKLQAKLQRCRLQMKSQSIRTSLINPKSEWKCFILSNQSCDITLLCPTKACYRLLVKSIKYKTG